MNHLPYGVGIYDARLAQRHDIYCKLIQRRSNRAPPVRFICFPGNILSKDRMTFQALPNLDGKHAKSLVRIKFDLLALPNEILLMIFEHLSLFDSATLTLSCKHLAGIATTYSFLDLAPQNSQKLSRHLSEEANFPKKRLGDKYFLGKLRYCWSCRHYVPRRGGYWKKHLSRRGWERNWQDCSYRVWKFSDWWAKLKTQAMLTQWKGGKTLHCPRCKLCKKLRIPVV